MAGDIDSGKYHLNSGELDFHEVRGVYFPEPINSSEIGVLYLKESAPQIGTAFTTHATVLGRSIAGNGQAQHATLCVNKLTERPG